MKHLYLTLIFAGALIASAPFITAQSWYSSKYAKWAAATALVGTGLSALYLYVKKYWRPKNPPQKVDLPVVAAPAPSEEPATQKTPIQRPIPHTPIQPTKALIGYLVLKLPHKEFTIRSEDKCYTLEITHLIDGPNHARLKAITVYAISKTPVDGKIFVNKATKLENSPAKTTRTEYLSIEGTATITKILFDKRIWVNNDNDGTVLLKLPYEYTPKSPPSPPSEAATCSSRD